MWKTSLIIIGVVVLVLAAVQFYVYSTTRNIESYPYKVVKTYPDFEIRKYAEASFSKVTLSDSSYRTASGRGFRKLASFIFGGNDREEDIAMTSPVLMEIGDSTTMQFMLPEAYSMTELPKPDDAEISFITESSRTMAAIRFGGWANDEKISHYKDLLFQALEKEGIAHNNRYFYAGYNPPFTLLGRRNEVLVQLIND